MKRLHFLLCACALSLIVMTPATSFALTFFTDRPTFDLNNPGLPIEDFEEAIVPVLVTSFIGPLDSTTNNAVFTPGDILPGIQLQATDNSIAVTNTGFLGIPSKAIGTNTFEETLNILFTTPVLAAGMDVYSVTNPSMIMASIFGEGNILLGSTIINANQTTPTFFGVSNMAPITRINLNSNSEQAEIIDNIAFGSPATGPAPVPEPSTMLLLGSGLLGLIGYRMRKPQA